MNPRLDVIQVIFVLLSTTRQIILRSIIHYRLWRSGASWLGQRRWYSNRGGESCGLATPYKTQRMVVGISLSRCTCEFWGAHMIIHCFNSLLEGLLGFLWLWGSWYSWKNGTREKCPDNQIVRIIEVRLLYKVGGWEISHVAMVNLHFCF